MYNQRPIKLQALLMTALGTPVLAALAVSTVVLVVRFRGTSVPDKGFWIGAATFGCLSVLALGLILRVAWRVRRTGQTGLSAALARWSPLLMVVGGVAGAMIATRMADSAIQSRAEFHARECLLAAEADEMAACVPIMRQCDIETRGGPGLTVDRAGKLSVDWPAGLKIPSNEHTRARVLCAWRRLNAGR